MAAWKTMTQLVAGLGLATLPGCTPDVPGTADTSLGAPPVDLDGDGFASPEDCDDEAADVNASAVEHCDGIDNDCDGEIDEGLTETYYRDGDGDGHGAEPTQACSLPSGHVTVAGDCDDDEAATHPGAAELCDGLDNNCDGLTDEGVTRTFYEDADGDGYGSGATLEACTAPTGYADSADDCEDTDPDIHPDRAEDCDFDDDNCNEQLNDGVDCLVYAHTYDMLYQVDPFLLSIEWVAEAPGLFDAATTPDGELYGITASELLWFDATTREWSVIGPLEHSADSINGLAIDSTGQAHGTIHSSVFAIDLEDAATTLIGEMSSDFSSSGDCVFDAADRLFMSSLASGTQSDDLIAIDPTTGQGQHIGSTGAGQVYGLSAVGGHLFGFTGAGELLWIDPSSGAGTLLTTFADHSFTGAASSPAH